jgi:sugar transferase (PEP-CTERM/EpsH1 system associated)
MRVLFLTHRLPYAPNRGDRIRAYYSLRTLAEHAEVDVASLVHSDEEAARVDDLKELAATVVTGRVPTLANRLRAVLALGSQHPLTHVLLDAPDFQERLERHVAERPPDVVLAYCSGMARFALNPPLREFPFVFDMVDVDSAKWADFARAAGGWKRAVYCREARLLGRFEAEAARRAAATLVVNDREAAVLRQLEPRATVHVVCNGIDATFFRPPHPPGRQPMVIFCGVMSYEPNAAAARWLAESIWPLVLRVRPDARLRLLGTDPPRSVCRLANREPSIEVTGTVPDVRPHLWDAAVGVAPLQTGRGVQNKVLEAIAAGLPCVVTRLVHEGLPPEVLGACRVGDTAEAFAGHIVDLLGTPPAERRAISARVHLPSLEWRRRLEALPRLLELAAGRSDKEPADGRRDTAQVGVPAIQPGR